VFELLTESNLHLILQTQNFTFLTKIVLTFSIELRLNNRDHLL